MTEKYYLKLFTYLLIGWIGGCVLSVKAEAVPESVYRGDWKTQDQNIDMRISIKRKSIAIEINGRTFEHIESEYLYAKKAALPFLCLQVRAGCGEGCDTYYEEHIIYLIIYGDGTIPGALNRLKGVYEYSKVFGYSEDASMETTLYSLELIRNSEEDVQSHSKK